MRRWIAILGALAAAAGCDRNVEPFDPNEEPAEPDLARIFPAGAGREPAGPPALPPAPGRGAPPLAAEAGAESEAPPIRGTISVAEELRGRVREGAVLFLIARRDGAGPPLAVRRIASPRFPLEFSLGPEDRMIQGLPFAGELRISARLDADGNALSRQPGDLEGRAERTVAPGASGVAVVLDEVLAEEDPGAAAQPGAGGPRPGPGSGR
jgi:cytochrome c-type biogenesis protein CcmH